MVPWWVCAFHVWQSKSTATTVSMFIVQFFSFQQFQFLLFNKQVLIVVQFYTETNFPFIPLCIFHSHFTPYFFSSVMPGTEAGPLLEPLEHDRCLFFYWLLGHYPVRSYLISSSTCTQRVKLSLMFTAQGNSDGDSSALLSPPWLLEPATCSGKVAMRWSYQGTAIWGTSAV